MNAERGKWLGRLEKIEDDLAQAKDDKYAAKKKSRDVVKAHLDKTKGMHSYIHCNSTITPLIFLVALSNHRSIEGDAELY